MIKRLIITILALFLTLNCALADSFSSWQLYNGKIGGHSYLLRFPQNWRVVTFGNSSIGISPENHDNEKLFFVDEFNTSSYDDVLKNYINPNVELLGTEDIVIQNNNDIIAKKANFVRIDSNITFSIVFVKRGNITLAISHPEFIDENDENREVLQNIFRSFRFTDNWHQYIDFSSGYFFSFPSSLDIDLLNNGVQIVDRGHLKDELVFEVLLYENTDLDDAIDESKSPGTGFISSEEISFHNLKATSAVYKELDLQKDFSYIFVENDDDTYRLTNTNIDNNYPHPDYYDDYISDVLESFDFFSMDEADRYYVNFPDVKNSHPNARAINWLFGEGVINGYPDGSFRPNGDINRAELTKMIVATKVDPDPATYKECFPDVQEQWFAPYICYAKEHGWVQGYVDGDFKPEKNINKVEALKIILGVLFEDEIDEDPELDSEVLDIDEDAWYAKYFIFADKNELLDLQHIKEHDNKYFYYPYENMTRKEVSETIFRSLNF